MPRKPVLAYAIGGTAAAVAAIVITASTVGLTPSTSEGARNDAATAPAVLPADGTVLTSYEDDEEYEDEDEHEHEERGEREHDDDD